MFCKVQKAVGCQSTPTCTQEGRKFKRQMKGSCSLDCPSQWQFCCAGLNHFSRVWLSVTLWTVVCQALLSMGFSRQEYWSRLPCLSARNLPNPGVKPASLMSSALAGGFFTNSTTWEVPSWMFTYVLSFFFLIKDLVHKVIGCLISCLWHHPAVVMLPLTLILTRTPR